MPRWCCQRRTGSRGSPLAARGTRRQRLQLAVARTQAALVGQPEQLRACWKQGYVNHALDEHRRPGPPVLTHGDLHRYADWVRMHDTLDDEDRKAIRNAIRRMNEPTFFSLILLPVPSSGVSLPHESIGSIRYQIYPYYELWVPEVTANLNLGSGLNIRLIPSTEQNDFVSMFNAALTHAEGDFVLPLPYDASLSETALYEMAATVEGRGAVALLYADEDQVSSSGWRSKPWFKTGWDPDLALGRDAIGLPVAYRKVLLKRLGGMRSRENSLALALYRLSLRAAFSVSPQHIHHIPAVLCHRATDSEGSLTCDGKAAREVVTEHLAELDERAAVEPASLVSYWNRIIWPLPDPAPLVSIIVPTRDHAELIERCAGSVLSRTDYPALELLIVDNETQEPTAVALLRDLSQDQRVRILTDPRPFNYAAHNNLAAREARGEVIVLLNNDTEVVHAEWLREMVSHAMRPDVGAVGAKLLYPDNRIQHAGMVLGPGLWPQHQLRFADRSDIGPFGELALTRTVSAITGACLALRRAVFFEAGALDEHLEISCNDVDLCLRIGDCGYRVVWTPFAELVHLESVSRGPDDSPEKQARVERELRYLWRRWGAMREHDPFHNPNLVYGWESVELSWPPRRRRPWLKCRP
jgi:GT2 family glycosyltransferase